MISIGRALRAARIRQNMSQSQVGRTAGMPRTYVSKIENGRSNPQMAQFIRLSEAIGIEPYRILRYACRLEGKSLSSDQITAVELALTPDTSVAISAQEITQR